MLARVKCGYDLYEQEKGKFFQKGDVCVYIDIRMLKQQNMEIKKNSPCSRIVSTIEYNHHLFGLNYVVLIILFISNLKKKARVCIT